jgi:lipoprotein NlpD
MSRRTAGLALALVVVSMLSGCGIPLNRAPVEDRSAPARGQAPVAPPVVVPGSAPAAAEVKPLPGAENAGKPGYYTVKAGDTVSAIAKIHNQKQGDLVRWNALPNPNLIEVGQVLRVVPPGADVGVAAVASPVAGASSLPVSPGAASAARPGDAKPGTAAASGAARPASAAAPAASAATPAVVAPVAASKDKDEDPSWAWPAGGAVVSGFDEVRNKGLDIGGKAGDPVYAAADGRVIHAGTGLRGYGNLVIIKHSDTFITAYAHNQALLVKEDQVVRKGQKIAEMGNTESETVKLHFEVRRQGKPVDPAKLLPVR